MVITSTRFAGRNGKDYKKSERVHAAYTKAIERAYSENFRETREMKEHSRRYLCRSLVGAFCLIVGWFALIANIWIVWVVAAIGMGYEVISRRIPDRGKKEVGTRAIYTGVFCVLWFVGYVVLDSKYFAVKLIGGILCVVLLVCYFSLVNRYLKQSRKSLGVVGDLQTSGKKDYAHPCEGQCDDPKIILQKSPTPKYQHACRAPCESATRSRRYKGKKV